MDENWGYLHFRKPTYVTVTWNSQPIAPWHRMYPHLTNSPWMLRPWAMGFVLRSSPLRHAQNRRFEGELVCNFRGSLLKSSSNVHRCMISIVAVVPAVLVDLIYRHSPYNHSSSFRPGFFGLWSSTWTVSDHWNMSDSVYGVWYRDTSH